MFNSKLILHFSRYLGNYRTKARTEQRLFIHIAIQFNSQSVTESHLGHGRDDTLAVDRISGNDLLILSILMKGFEQLHDTVVIGKIVLVS